MKEASPRYAVTSLREHYGLLGWETQDWPKQRWLGRLSRQLRALID